LPRFKPAAPPAPVRPARADVTAPDTDEFIRAAITTGLTEDGASPTLIADLAKREDYVPKCFICESSRHALRDYGKRDKQPAAKEGRGLSEELVKRLKSDADETRRAALRELVAGYIDREYARRDLTAGQKAALQKKLEEMRRAAMGGLRGGQKFCPSCDGACRLGPRL
jgi:hypothetical protein